MKFQFEGLDEIVEINFNFKNSDFIQALDPDESIPILIPERFPKHHIMIFKELLEIMETKPELSDDEKHLGLSSIITPLITYFSFNKEFKDRFKSKSQINKKIYNVFLVISINNTRDTRFKVNEEKIGCCESLEDVSILIKKYIIKNNYDLFKSFQSDYVDSQFEFYLDLDKKNINLELGKNWKYDFDSFIDLDDTNDTSFSKKTSILTFEYYKRYLVLGRGGGGELHHYSRKIDFLIQESILEDYEIIKAHPETPYNFTLNPCFP